MGLKNVTFKKQTRSYLENYLESVSALPADTRRQLALMRELDTQCQGARARACLCVRVLVRAASNILGHRVDMPFFFLFFSLEWWLRWRTALLQQIEQVRTFFSFLSALVFIPTRDGAPTPLLCLCRINKNTLKASTGAKTPTTQLKRTKRLKGSAAWCEQLAETRRALRF